MDTGVGASGSTLGVPHHLDLTVSDINASIEFYDRVLGRLGYERTDQYSGGAPCWLYPSTTAFTFGIALHQSTSPMDHDRYAPGMHHLAFNARDRQEVDSFYEYLLANDLEILDPPAEYDYTPGYYAVFFADPDGIKLELIYEPKPESGRR